MAIAFVAARTPRAGCTLRSPRDRPSITLRGNNTDVVQELAQVVVQRASGLDAEHESTGSEEPL